MAIMSVKKLSFTSKNGLKVQQNRFFSHLKLQNFYGVIPQITCALPPTRAFGLDENRRRSMAVPLSKSRRRPCFAYSKQCILRKKVMPFFQAQLLEM